MLISPNNIQTGQPKLTRIEKCAIRIIQCKSGLQELLSQKAFDLLKETARSVNIERTMV